MIMLEFFMLYIRFKRAVRPRIQSPHPTPSYYANIKYPNLKSIRFA
jgi:hypothetical protein